MLKKNQSSHNLIVLMGIDCIFLIKKKKEKFNKTKIQWKKRKQNMTKIYEFMKFNFREGVVSIKLFYIISKK
jgi:hypothetical protein